MPSYKLLNGSDTAPAGNMDRSYVTIASFPGLMFGIINIVGLSRSVCLSHPATQPQRAAGLLLWARWAGDIDRQRRAPVAQRRHSTALSSKCEQCYVHSRRRRLNINLLIFAVHWWRQV